MLLGQTWSNRQASFPNPGDFVLAKTIILEVEDSAQEQLIRNYHALVMEVNDLALTAPDATVIDPLEEHAIQRRRETLRASLEQAVQKRLDAAEKKGRQAVSAPVAKSGKTAARASGNGSVAWGR